MNRQLYIETCNYFFTFDNDIDLNECDISYVHCTVKKHEPIK